MQFKKENQNMCMQALKSMHTCEEESKDDGNHRRNFLIGLLVNKLINQSVLLVLALRVKVIGNVHLFLTSKVMKSQFKVCFQMSSFAAKLKAEKTY